MNKRIIPCLLLKEGGLWKTERFRSPRYVGDPINTVRVFNDKEVDELMVLDIEATPAGKPIDLRLIGVLAEECFMPLCYGGGIRTLTDAQRLFELGIEKISLNTAALENVELVEQIATRFGTQSVVVSIDVKRDRLGRRYVYTHGGSKRSKVTPVDHARRMEAAGAGELLVTSIDREGTREGYDIDLSTQVARAVGIPVIANGGAGSNSDLAEVLGTEVSAAAAGTLFVFRGKHRAVLISYPLGAERKKLLAGR